MVYWLLIDSLVKWIAYWLDELDGIYNLLAL